MTEEKDAQKYPPKDALLYSTKLGNDTIILCRSIEIGQDAFLKEVGELRKKVEAQFPSAAEKQATAATSDGAGDETGEFSASRLVKSVVDGKAYWKVAGHDGKFPKFPVAIWPEVIERDLCPMDKLTKDAYPLDGYTAVFEKNDKGNPKKVIALKKAS